MTIFFLFFILFKSTKTADRAAEESAGDDREARRALHGETSAAGQVRRGRREWRQAKQGRQSESREQPPPQEQDAQRQTAQGVAQPRRPNPSKTADAIFFSFLFFFFRRSNLLPLACGIAALLARLAGVWPPVKWTYKEAKGEISKIY